MINDKLLRGDRDFVDEAAYLGFVRMVLDQERNAPAAARLAAERAYLRPLPAARDPGSTRRSSTGCGSGARFGGRRPDLLGAVAVDRSHGRGTSASRRRRPGAVHDTASAGLDGAPDRLPPHHREPGPEAGRQAGHSVLCALVQELLGAKRDLDLPRALRKLDLYEVILLDDLGYVSAEPGRGRGAVHAARAERYERRSVMVTSNLVFSQWDRILPRPDGAGRRDRPPRTPRRRA